MNVLMWFRRDLRSSDHPALAEAAASGAVLPLYIIAPSVWAAATASGRQWDFISESLQELRDSLARLGAPLVVRVGEVQDVLPRMVRQNAIDRICLTEAGQDDPDVSALRDWALGRDLIWSELPAPRPQQPALPAPQLQALAGIEPGALPHARALKLAEARCPHRQYGGRSRAEAQLRSFLTKRGLDYLDAQQQAALAERASSRLSPYLAHGVLSQAEVARACEAQAAIADPAWVDPLHRFRQNLLQRRRKTQQAMARPASQPAALTLFPCRSRAERFRAWKAGETGLPFLDASMRYLAKTGWLNHPMRAMAASVALHQLDLPFDAVSNHLARLCTDYDPQLHGSYMAGLAAGSKGIDPVRLGERLDPQGQFIRRWLPELAALPDSAIHSPWRWAQAGSLLGNRYPEPIANPAGSAPMARKSAAAPSAAPEQLALAL